MSTPDTPTKGVRYWNRMSGAHEWLERMPTVGGFHRIMRNSTGLRAGETVLDLGCGAGSYFRPLRETIGAEGHLVGVDVAPAMLARAEARVAREGWANVETRLADATDPNLPAELGAGRFDAAFAMYSISAMPDIAAGVRNVHAALRPGGRLFVADVRLVPGGKAAGAIRALRWLYRRLAGASGNDVVPHLREVFDEVALVDGRGEPHDHPLAPWPPLVMLVATKA
jgi:ubiquinone/menaquinone biosynthesis C-methylase UbiE